MNNKVQFDSLRWLCLGAVAALLTLLAVSCSGGTTTPSTTALGVTSTNGGQDSVADPTNSDGETADDAVDAADPNNTDGETADDGTADPSDPGETADQTDVDDVQERPGNTN